jgi:hypothetical protein
MDKLPYLVAALGCPLGMGAMMWYMMRPGNPAQAWQPGAPASPAVDLEIAGLRAELDHLSAAQRNASAPQDSGADLAGRL